MKVINHFWRQFDVWFCISVASNLKVKTMITWNSIHLILLLYFFLYKKIIFSLVYFTCFNVLTRAKLQDAPYSFIYDKNTLCISSLITPFWWVRNQICWIPSSNYWGVKLMLIISTMLSMSGKIMWSRHMKSEIQIKYDFWTM